MSRKRSGRIILQPGEAYFWNVPIDFRFTPAFRDTLCNASKVEQMFIRHVVNRILARRYRGLITCSLDHQLNVAMVRDWPSAAVVEQFQYAEWLLSPWRPAMMLAAKIGGQQSVIGIMGDVDPGLIDENGNIIGGGPVGNST
jgi:hypothetical protein